MCVQLRHPREQDLLILTGVQLLYNVLLASVVQRRDSDMASLVAQLVKNLPAMQETLIRFLGWEDLLEKGQATHSSILGLPRWFSCQRIHLQCGKSGFDLWVGKMLWSREKLPTPVCWPGEFHGLYRPWGCKESDTTEQLSLSKQERLSKYIYMYVYTQGDRILPLLPQWAKQDPVSPNSCHFSWNYLLAGMSETDKTHPPLLCGQEMFILLLNTSSSPQESTASQSLIPANEGKKILPMRKFLLEQSNKAFLSNFSLLLLICKRDAEASPTLLHKMQKVGTLCLKRCVHAPLLSHVQLLATAQTLAHQAPLAMGILQARILEWVAISWVELKKPKQTQYLLQPCSGRRQ